MVIAPQTQKRVIILPPSGVTSSFGDFGFSFKKIAKAVTKPVTSAVKTVVSVPVKAAASAVSAVGKVPIAGAILKPIVATAAVPLTGGAALLDKDVRKQAAIGYAAGAAIGGGILAAPLIGSALPAIGSAITGSGLTGTLATTALTGAAGQLLGGKGGGSGGGDVGAASANVPLPPGYTLNERGELVPIAQPAQAGGIPSWVYWAGGGVGTALALYVLWRVVKPAPRLRPATV